MTPGVLEDQGRLPADAETIKTALIAVAVHRYQKGDLSNEQLAAFKTGYCMLANFVAAEAASDAATVWEAMRKWREGERTPDQTREMAASIRSLSADKFVGSPAETAALLVEFDARWGEAVAQGVNRGAELTQDVSRFAVTDYRVAKLQAALSHLSGRTIEHPVVVWHTDGRCQLYLQFADGTAYELYARDLDGSRGIERASLTDIIMRSSGTSMRTLIVPPADQGVLPLQGGHDHK